MTDMSKTVPVATQGPVARLHRRQFLFTDASLQSPDEWLRVDLGRGFTLHHCPDLSVRICSDASGHTWALLGNAFETRDGDTRDPLSRVANTATHEVDSIVDTWAGRWLLLSASAVITDAAALLGVYVATGAGRTIVSSSIAMLASLTGAQVNDDRKVGWYGLNWYPGPSSKYAGIVRLMPDQIFNPQNGEVRFFDRLRITERNGVQAAARKIADGIARSLAAMHEKDLHLALTGGLDSRTTFAVLVASGVRFDAVTLQHPRISTADRLLPPDIAGRFGIPHRFIDAGKSESGLVELYDMHTAHCVVDGDRYFFGGGSYRRTSSSGWLIRSGCWEIGRKYFHKKLNGLTLDEVADKPRRLLTRFHCFAGARASADAISAWARWRLSNPVQADWQDLFYRDQRLGGWLSAIEQSLDLLDQTSIQPVNCDHFYAAMLSVDDRGDSQNNIQQKIIELCAPSLAETPVNPSMDNTYFAIKGKLDKISAMAVGELRNFMFAGG